MRFLSWYNVTYLCFFSPFKSFETLKDKTRQYKTVQDSKFCLHTVRMSAVPPPEYEEPPSWAEIEKQLVRRTVDRRHHVKQIMLQAKDQYSRYLINQLQLEIWDKCQINAQKGKDSADLRTETYSFEDWLQENYTEWVNLDENIDMVCAVAKEAMKSIRVESLSTLQTVLPNCSISMTDDVYHISWAAQAAKLYRMEHSYKRQK